MGSVYALTLRQLAGKWRLMIMAVLAAMPVAVTALIMATGHSPDVAEFDTIVFNGMLAGSIAPLVILAIATAAFANELEDQTLANLTLAPLSRWKIALAKLLAAVTIAAPFIAASALGTAWIAYLGDPRAALAVTAGALVEVALYSSAFVWLGLVTSQAIGAGLLYIVLWEGFFAGFVAGVRFLSIRYYSLAAMHAIDPRRIAETEHLPGVTVAAVFALVVGGFLWLSVRRLRRMDVP
jgi:ABC-2 type transport system permease protein